MSKKFLIVICFVLICAAAWGAMPIEWYTLDDNGVIRRGNKRIKAETKPIEGLNSVWLMVSPSTNPDMEGSKRAVWIYNLDNLEHAPLYIPLKKVECTEIYYDSEANVYNLVLSSGIAATYANDGELIRETPLSEFKRPGSQEQEPAPPADTPAENEEDFDDFFK